MKVAILTALCILLAGISYIHGQGLHLDIKGKDSTETGILQRLEFHPFHENMRSVYEETARLQEELYRKGYLQHTLDSLIKKDTVCTAYFSLEDKIDTIKVKIDRKYSGLLKDAGIRAVNDSIAIPPEAFETTLQKLSGQFEAYGDPFSEIKLIDIDIKNNTLRGILAISETRVRKLDKIVVKGYEKFPLSILKRIGKIKEGERFNRMTLIEKTEKLALLPYIDRIKPPEILFLKDTTQLYIYIKKVNANYFDGFLGFATDKTTQKLILNGYLDVRLLNNLNRGEQLTLSWKDNGSRQRIFKANVKIPYIFRSAFGVQAAIDIVKQDTVFTNTTTAASLHYNFNARAYAGWGIEHTESAGFPHDALPEIEVPDYTSFFVKSMYTYILPEEDIPVFNEKLKLDLAFSLGKRKFSNTHTPQQKVYADVSYQWNLNYKNRIYVRNLTELLLSEAYLYNEKYRFGGINTIRGFNENSLEATFYNVINTEYRLLLSKTLYLNSIFDVAYAEDRTFNTKTTLYGFGFGLGAITSGGILKINYALGKFEKTPVTFSDAKLHLSFSTFF